jgi:hypothetical protein
MTTLRTAIVGAGKMGKIHAKVYSQLDQAELVAVVDSDPERAAALAEKYGCAAFTDPAELIGKVDAVTIAAPTQAHHAVATLLLSHRIPVLIEKPLAASAAEGRKIDCRWPPRFDTVVAVGHSERCNPVVQAMKRLNIEPKFIEAQRRQSLSVPLDRHRCRAGHHDPRHRHHPVSAGQQDPGKSVDAAGVNVIEDHEDICNARIIFDNGCIANVTASRLALKTERRVRLFSAPGLPVAGLLPQGGHRHQGRQEHRPGQVDPRAPGSPGL